MKDKVIHLRISETLLDRFDKVLEKEGVSRAHVLTEAIRNYIEKENVKMEISYEMIIDTLSNWGSNEGDIEEIASILASEENAISSADAEISDDEGVISYCLTLTEKGKEIYEEWCRKHEHISKLKKGNVLLFEDENADSVKNTLEEWNG